MIRVAGPLPKRVRHVLDRLNLVLDERDAAQSRVKELERVRARIDRLIEQRLHSRYITVAELEAALADAQEENDA
jgi:hypothetical protein